MTNASKPQFSLDALDGEAIPLPPRNGMNASVHVIDRRSIRAVEAAMTTGRPLLVRGEPGVGKSQLARAVAEKLRRALVVHTIDARTETRDLLWNIDTVRRLAEAQVMAAHHHIDHAEVLKRIDLANFVVPGPLWWAFRWGDAYAQASAASMAPPTEEQARGSERGVVLLIDEIDKADASVPNGLLDALGHGRFDAPGPKTVAVDPERKPVVIITTNEERALPDAFVRRCLVLQMEVPADATKLEALLIARAEAHFGANGRGLYAPAAKMLIEDRAVYREQGVTPPGIAEFVDLLRAVIEQHPGNLAAQSALMAEVREFTFQKHPRELDP